MSKKNVSSAHTLDSFFSDIGTQYLRYDSAPGISREGWARQEVQESEHRWLDKASETSEDEVETNYDDDVEERGTGLRQGRATAYHEKRKSSVD
jgi:hypothetical protein